MFFKLFLLFLVIPFIEVAVLIKMATVIGFWPTLIIQVGTAIAGAALARLQGWLLWARIAKELATGHLPAEELVDAFLIFTAGMILLTPGLVTDLLGLLILFPSVRAAIRAWLRRRFEKLLFRKPVRIIDIV
jgi:UPF0716 protein FxsA